MEQRLHFQRCPLSINIEKGFIYDLHLRQRAIIVSETKGTFSSSSVSIIKGRIANAKGSLDFLRRLLFFGIAFKVDRKYSGPQFVFSVCIKDALEGKISEGGGRFKSKMSGGCPIKSTEIKGLRENPDVIGL